MEEVDEKLAPYLTFALTFDDMLQKLRKAIADNDGKAIAELFETQNFFTTQDFNITELLTEPLIGHNTLLHMAAANGREKAVTAIIQTSESIPALTLKILTRQNKEGKNPLHLAALNGHVNAVKAFFDTKNINQTLLLKTRDRQGRTPHDLARINKHHEIMEFLSTAKSKHLFNLRKRLADYQNGRLTSPTQVNDIARLQAEIAQLSTMDPNTNQPTGGSSRASSSSGTTSQTQEPEQPRAGTPPPSNLPPDEI
jgi:hypothetical protein